MNWIHQTAIGLLFMSITQICFANGGSSAKSDMLQTKIVTHVQKTEPIQDKYIIPTITVNEIGVTITFSVPVKYQVVCKSKEDYHLDRIFNGFTDEDRNIQILKCELPAGVWLLQIKYTVFNKNYYFEKEVVID